MNKTSMRIATVAAAVAVCLFAVGSSAFGQGIDRNSAELPPDGVYLSPDDVHAMYSGPGLAIVLKAIQHRVFRKSRKYAHRLKPSSEAP